MGETAACATIAALLASAHVAASGKVGLRSTTVLGVDHSALTTELRQRITFPDGHADVWPLFYTPDLLRRVVDALAEPLDGAATKIAGIESRGFLLGAAVALRLGVGFVAIRGSQAIAAKSLIVEAGAGYAGASIIVDQLDEATRQQLAPCHSLISAGLLG